MMPAVREVNAVAAEAASLPGADPSSLGRISELAQEIGREYSRTDGMDLSLVRAGAAALGGGRNRGGFGSTVTKFVRDVILKTASDATGDWLYEVGITGDEHRRDSAEGVQRDNTRQLCDSLENCCQAIDEVDNTADHAIEALLNSISGLLMICRLHPVGRVLGLILPLVVSGMEQIRDVVVDRNTQLGGCWREVTDSCGAMLEHQPEDVKTWQCPDLTPPTNTVPEPEEVRPPALTTGHGCTTGAVETECAPAEKTTAAPVSTPVGKDCPPSVSHNVDTCDHGHSEPEPQITAADTGTVAASVGQTPQFGSSEVTLNLCLETDKQPHPATELVQEVECPEPAAAQPPQCEATSSESCLVGPLAAVGLGIALECLNYLTECAAECIAESAQCANEVCEDVPPPPAEIETPPVEPTVEECPPPVEPVEQPTLEEGTIPPPAELAEVDTPPMPEEKLRAAGLEVAPVDIAAPEQTQVAPEPPPVTEQPVVPDPVPEPDPAPSPGDIAPEKPQQAEQPGSSLGGEQNSGPKMRKSGEW